MSVRSLLMMAAAPKSLIWSPVTLPAANVWKAIAFGNNTFVLIAGANNDRTLTSPDGLTWTDRGANMPPPGTDYWAAMAFGNGRFVAVTTALSGDAGWTANNGVSWTASSVVAADNWASIAYGAGLFVATQDSGDALCVSSPDGATWTNRTMVSGYYVAITYGGGRFVALTQNGNTETSPDGLTWTAHSNVLPTTTGIWDSIAYGNGRFVALASGADIAASSTDGVVWSQSTPPANGNQGYARVAFGNGLFVGFTVNSTTTFITSLDGVNWTAGTMPGTPTSWVAAYGAGKFVAADAGGSSSTRCMVAPF